MLLARCNCDQKQKAPLMRVGAVCPRLAVIGRCSAFEAKTDQFYQPRPDVGANAWASQNFSRSCTSLAYQSLTAGLLDYGDGFWWWTRIVACSSSLKHRGPGLSSMHISSTSSSSFGTNQRKATQQEVNAVPEVQNSRSKLNRRHVTV
jgi:hypothetical protein